MTNTSPKAVERYSPDVIDRGVGPYAIMEQDPQGDYVTYNDYAALSAQLADATARADALHKAQSYQYIGKDGKSVLARDLEDQLEAANARADRARDDALVEAAREVTKALAMQDAGCHVQLVTLMQAIHALRTQPPPSVEPVTVTLGDLRPIWKEHGGGWHGPRVEHWSIPEANVTAFFNAALAQLKEPKP